MPTRTDGIIRSPTCNVGLWASVSAYGRRPISTLFDHVDIQQRRGEVKVSVANSLPVILRM